MDRNLFIKQLEKVLSEIGGPTWAIEKVEDCPNIDKVLRSSCFIAFFAVVEQAELLTDIYQKAQAEIVRLRGAEGAKWPRDLNLVLLITDNTFPDPATTRQLVDDRYICRKFVLCMNGCDIQDVLSDLPFWPPTNLFADDQESVVMSVQEAVKGHDPLLVADLASRSPGAERVFEKIQKGEYNLITEPPKIELIQPAQFTPLVFTKLEALDIMNFRGIRRLCPEDMPLSGDIVFIYGPNGVGKTSIADAMEWAITGQVDRLEQHSSRSAKNSPDPIVNVFSDKDETQVACHLSNHEVVHRKKCGRSVERMIGSKLVPDDRALIDYVVGTKAPSSEVRLRIERLRTLFRGSHMLSQHDIRQFLEKTEPTERFDILTNMIGAEEFVRFREKVATVLRHLRAHVKNTVEENKLLKRELADMTARLCERKKELIKLSHAVTSGETPENIVSGLLQGLRNSQCTIDESVIERANAEPAERRFELIAIYAETAIRSKKLETDDLLVRLKSLGQELQGYIKTKTRLEGLAIEVTSIKTASEKDRIELQKQEKLRQDIQKLLQTLKTRQLEVLKHYTDLAWLKDNITTYGQSQEKLQLTKGFLSSKMDELQRSEAALEEQQKTLSANQILLQEIDQTITTKAKRKRLITAIVQQLSNIQAKWQDTKRLEDKEKQVSLQVSELKNQEKSARDGINLAKARMDELQRNYNSEANRHDALSSFLAKLGELVNSAECPLCGRDFTTAKEAKDIIQEHLSAIPIQLKEAAGLLGEAKKNIFTKETHINSIIARLRVLEDEEKQIHSAKVDATRTVQDFLLGCNELAINVSAKDEASWQKILEQALKESETTSLCSQADNFKKIINELNSRIAEQQNVVKELQQKVVKNEEQRTRLVIAIQEFKKNVIQRGFEIASLPEAEQLVAKTLRAQDETKKCIEETDKKGAELRLVESMVAGLREKLKRNDEDVASKEVQIQEYETTCSRFTAACRSIGIDPEDPERNICLFIQKTSDINQLLSDSEKKRQVLQQIVSLGRLKREVDDLAKAEGNVKSKFKITSDEEAKLQNWVSRLVSLESEVVKRQVDVVGTHLKRLEPTTQRLYHRLNPHPIFGKVRIRVNDKKRELDVEAEASVNNKKLQDIMVSPSLCARISETVPCH